MAVLEQIAVYDPGWGQRRTLDVSGLSASWGISDAGRLTCVGERSAVKAAAGSSGEILGRWVLWTHATMGSWAGYVEDATVDLEQGTVELGCVGLVNLLAYRRTALGYGPQQLSPGGLVMRATRDSADDDAVWLAEVEADESPAMVRYEWTGESVMELMMTLVDETGEEWVARSDADGRQTLEWRLRAGSTAVVGTFVEGLGVLGGTIERSIAQMVNDLAAVADDDQYELSDRARVVDRASILAFGRRQTLRRYRGIVTQSTLEPVARRELGRLTQPVEVATLLVSHLDDRLLAVREGSRVLVTSSSANRVYRARVIARSVRVLDGVGTLVCEVEAVVKTRPLVRTGITTQYEQASPPAAGLYTAPD